MTQKKYEITTAGSDRIPQRRIGEGFGKSRQREARLTAGLRSTGISGPSREVSQCDHAPSGAVCAGRDDDELRWAQKHVPEEVESHAKRSVFRKTELHHTSPGSTGGDAAKARKRVDKELDNPMSGVTLRPYETAFRDLICSIVGHQDLAEEKLFLDIADLQQQITELQEQVGALEQKLGVTD
ncbi:MAG: hypothetical protein LUQ66_03765 [Methanoregula sp.]|nr:hypothetical protein [Methanoregula sp.]